MKNVPNTYDASRASRIISFSASLSVGVSFGSGTGRRFRSDCITSFLQNDSFSRFFP